MNTSSIIAMSEAQYQQQLVDTIWHAAVNQIRGGCAEIVLTAYEGRQIGQSGINVVAQRFRYDCHLRLSLTCSDKS